MNQYTSRTVPSAVDILGEATNAATVTVNNQPTYRHGTFYRDQLAIGNVSAPAWQSVTNLAVLNQGANADIIATNSGNIFLPQTPEQFTYDADGNLTSDGRWTNTWDAENRLISMESLTNGPAGSKLRLTFAYDYQSRRITKTVESFNGSAWNTTVSNKFAYDGWKLLGEVNGTNNGVIRVYMWGSDLSGSMQGAGGVGGLLAVSSQSSAQFTSFDGNGNITALIDTSTSSVSGQYEYGAFGESVRCTGSGKINPFRFSTKYQDEESSFSYYGYRYYVPSSGRWLSRDPIEEQGGFNLCGLGGNDGVNQVDPVGLKILAKVNAESCQLDVTINFAIQFLAPWTKQAESTPMTDYQRGLWNWTESEKAEWKQDFKNLVEAYFSNLSFKCQNKCARCPEGIKVKMNVIFDSEPDANALKVYAGSVIQQTDDTGTITLRKEGITTMSTATPDGKVYWSVPALHETGHVLGLKHPGQRYYPQPAPNSIADYDADPDSLMGRGLEMRIEDFKDAFCSRVDDVKQK